MDGWNLPLNWELLKAPENWVIVTLMVVIAALGLAMLFPHHGMTAETEA